MLRKNCKVKTVSNINALLLHNIPFACNQHNGNVLGDAVAHFPCVTTTEILRHLFPTITAVSQHQCHCTAIVKTFNVTR